jgi:hypothetical protein
MADYVDTVTAVIMEKDPGLLQEANRRRIDKGQGVSLQQQQCEACSVYIHKF